MAKAVKHLCIIPRKEWDAQVPLIDLEPLSRPLRKVSFHYDTKTDMCDTYLDCCRTIYEIQERQMAAGSPDIDYNFLIGNDGNVYEGRGWKYKPECAEKYPACNDYTVEIAYIGDFRARNQPYIMFLSAMALVDWGVFHGVIHKDFTWVGFEEKQVDYSKNSKRKVPPPVVTRSRT